VGIFIIETSAPHFKMADIMTTRNMIATFEAQFQKNQIRLPADHGAAV
jgi:hypothetical protein